jgi:anaphase-promoting complex subunit 1
MERDEVVNSDAVGPGAIVSLALMYLKSNDLSAARKLDLPQLAFEIEQMRPDMFLYRAVGRSLIMWNDVQPTENWIRQSIPPVIIAIYYQLYSCESIKLKR